jgi:hypothetical protein
MELATDRVAIVSAMVSVLLLSSLQWISLRFSNGSGLFTLEQQLTDIIDLKQLRNNLGILKLIYHVFIYSHASNSSEHSTHETNAECHLDLVPLQSVMQQELTASEICVTVQPQRSYLNLSLIV